MEKLWKIVCKKLERIEYVLNMDPESNLESIQNRSNIFYSENSKRIQGMVTIFKKII